jgi:hypothetical protein
MDGLHPVVLHQRPPGITADWQLTHRDRG